MAFNANEARKPLKRIRHRRPRRGSNTTYDRRELQELRVIVPHPALFQRQLQEAA